MLHEIMDGESPSVPYETSEDDNFLLHGLPPDDVVPILSADTLSFCWFAGVLCDRFNDIWSH